RHSFRCFTLWCPPAIRDERFSAPFHNPANQAVGGRAGCPVLPYTLAIASIGEGSASGSLERCTADADRRLFFPTSALKIEPPIGRFRTRIDTHFRPRNDRERGVNETSIN